MKQNLRTNRDLYRAIQELCTQHENLEITLETYLLALLNRSTPFSDRVSLSLNEFYELIAGGFIDQPAPFDQTWRDQYDKLMQEYKGYLGWRACVICQIVDLREMDESGTLDNPFRYYGVRSPRGSRWFNFDPLNYLECAAAGSFGGWNADEDSGRQYVPGPVMAFTKEGFIETLTPRDLPNPVVEIPNVTWEAFVKFVSCGQSYE